MKILLGCLNVNGLGGSELYHYELVRELHNLGCNVTLFTLKNINPIDQVRIKLNNLGIKQIDLNNININEKYDIMVTSQPQTTLYLLQTFKNTPIINIIHSEIRSEDPIINSKINHYIGIRQPIIDMLTKNYNIPSDKVSLIYNPIDQNRFNNKNLFKLEKYSGIFIGEVLDPIRFKAIQHLAHQCIENDWDLYIMSNSRYNFNHSNIKYLDNRWDTEDVVKNMHFTAGILLGRTTLEGWCCDVPGFIYLIDIYGNILDIETTPPENIKQLCDSKYVANCHIQLYNKIIELK
jgi:hypothetical protein